MILDWAISTTVLLSIILGAFVASILLNNVFEFRSNRFPKDDPIEEAFAQAKINNNKLKKTMYQQIAFTYFNQILTSIVTIFLSIFEIPVIVVHAFTVMSVNRQLIVLVTITSLIGFMTFNNGPLLLEKFDGLYSCAITPFVNNILFSILYVINLVWAAFIPFYNIWVILARQAITGTFLIATKCATSSLSLAGFIKDFANYFTTIFEETVTFTGINADDFARNNMIYNEFKVYPIMEKWRYLFRFLPETFSCFCKATSDFTDLFFYGWIESDRIDWIVHHFINTFLSFFQTFVKIIPPFLEYPNFDTTFYNIANGIWEWGKLGDEWFFEIINTIMNTVNVNGGIIIDTPKVFVFEAFTHWLNAIVNVLHTFIDAMMHLLLPFDTTPITNTKFMAQLFKLEETFTHASLLIHSISHITTWTSRVLIEMLLSAIYINKCANLPAASCVNFINGQCSVSCISTTQIKIHDVDMQCLIKSDAKNKYNYQKATFDLLIKDTSNRFFSDIEFFETSQFLPLEDKNIYTRASKINSQIFYKIYYDNIILRDINFVDTCESLATNRRKQCYNTLFENELMEAYGAKGGGDFYSSVGCSIESALLIPTNVIQITHSFAIDYFWFNVIGYFKGNQRDAFERVAKMKKNGEDFRALLRAYVGPMFGRDYEPPCHVVYNFTKSRHFNDSNAYKDFLLENNDKCKQPNFNEHIFYHMDRLGYFLIANVFQKDTLGKFFFNIYRFTIEQFRIILRLEAEGYGLFSSKSQLFVNHTVVDGPTSSFFQREIGCLYEYGNKTHSKRGFCSNATFQSEGSQCDVYDNSLDYTTECKCLKTPSLTNSDYVVLAEKNTVFYSTKAISRWCNLNLWEFNYIFLARAFNGLRNFVHNLNLLNLQEGFPPPTNICDTNEYQYTTSTTISTIFDNDCIVKGYKDFFCPTGELLQRSFLTISNLLRKEQRNFIFLFAGMIEDIDLRISDNVCDVQNTFMALANSISALFVFDPRIQEPFTKLLFSFGNIVSIPLELSVLMLRGVRAFVTGDASIIQTGLTVGNQAININSVRNIVLNLLSTFIKVATRHVTDLCESSSAFLNTIVACNSGSVCAGSIFDILKLIVEIIESITSDVVLATLLDFVELFARMIQVLVSPGDIGVSEMSALITKMMDAVVSIVELLVSNASLWLSFLFDTLLGPVGDIIKAVQSAICSVLSIDLISGALSIDTSFCGGTSSGGGGGGGGGGGTFLDGLGGVGINFGFRRRRLFQTDNSSILHNVATEFNWDGTSKCDKIILAYKDYDINQMSPLEKIEWGECLYYRLSMEMVEKSFRIGVPHDLFYNWYRKYTVAFDVSIGSYIYITWHFEKNGNEKTLKSKFENYGYNPIHAMNLIRLVKKMGNEFFSWKNLRKSFEILFTEKEKGVLLYKNVRKLHTHVTKTEWTASVLKTKKALDKFWHQHLKLNKKITFTNAKIFSSDIENMLSIYDTINMNTFGEMYGAFTSLQCPPDSILCLNCVFVDNYIYNVIYQLRNASTFYREDFAEIILPDFEAYWQNVSSYNARYTKAYKKAVDERTTEIFGGTLEPTVSFTEFFDGFLNGTYTTQTIVDGISFFLQGNYSGTIPPDATILFQNDLQYYIELPFKVGCDEAEWKWTSSKDNVGNGIFGVFMVFLLLEIFRFLVGDFNILITISIYSTALLFSQYLYMFITYGYNPLCTPIAPAYFFYDFIKYLDEVVFLDCACGYLPYLSKEPCVQQTCDSCNVTTTFHDCKDLLPALDNLGMLWPFVFVFRWIFTDTFRYLGNLGSWPFPFIFSNDGMSRLLSDVNRNLDITGVESNCFYLHILTPISILILVYLGILISIPLINIAVRTTKELTMMFINSIFVLYYLSLASRSS